ncbi:MAG: hypothetical protein IH934_04630 [Nanoarchaeota archaeon]|nr:hypothetical protein [Nanoarchaeota archaeon]
MAGKKTRRDIAGILGLGIGLGVVTRVESVARLPIPVVTQFAPVAATVSPLIGARIVFRQLNRLPLGKTNVIKPIKRRRFL